MSKRIAESTVNPTDSKNILNKFSKNSNESSKVTLNKYTASVAKVEEESKEVDTMQSKNPVKKNRINLKNLEELPSSKVSITVTKSDYNDLPITPALKQKQTNKSESNDKYDKL